MLAGVDRYLSGVPIGILQPNVILPSQDVRARKPLTPEQRLMIAVLRDAINCLEKYRFATNYRGRRLFGEVTQWLGARDGAWPYSFESICEVLGLDANAVRQRLGVAQEQQPVAVVARSTAGVCAVQDDLRIAD
jgi:hypothetical protein